VSVCISLFLFVTMTFSFIKLSSFWPGLNSARCHGSMQSPCRIPNYLGDRPWLMKRSFQLHVIAIGFLALIMSITTFLFALGVTVTIFQLIVRITCKAVFERELSSGVNVSDVCIT
jgi:hypothetical protein